MKFRELQDGETRVIVLRHGTTGKQKKELPNDTICKESYQRVWKLGRAVREAGVIINHVIISPRGRAVKTAFAFAEGNALPGETIPAFQTEVRITDVSSTRPELVDLLCAYAKKHGGTPEQAILACEHDYLWTRIDDYAITIVKLINKNPGKTELLCGHGALAEAGILLLKNPAAGDLAELGQPVKWLDKGGAVELIFDSNGQIVEENYLN